MKQKIKIEFAVYKMGIINNNFTKFENFVLEPSGELSDKEIKIFKKDIERAIEKEIKKHETIK